MTTEAANLVDKVHQAGGRVILLLFVDRPPQISVTLSLRGEQRKSLIDELRQHRNAVIAELRRRYLTGAVLSERVQ